VYTINKTLNQYVEAVPRRVYEDTPKAVWAAIAISLATCGGDRLDDATRALMHEWGILHMNGIIPQAVPSHLRKFDVEVEEEMIPSDHCLYCANGDEPDGEMHYFTSHTGLTKSYPCKDWTPRQRQDGPFRSLADMVYTECPCGCGADSICEAQLMRVRAHEAGMPY
jgi:hypothetical protein